MSYYYPFGTATSKNNISYAESAISASVPTVAAKTTLVATATSASFLVSPAPAGTSGFSRVSVDCAGGGTSGAQGAQGAQGPAGADKTTGMCPPGTKECTALNADLAALNAGIANVDNHFGVVCLDLGGQLESALDCPGTLPVGIPTLPVY